MVNVTRVNRVVKPPEATDPYKLINVLVGDKTISARPYEFDTTNNVMYPTRFITMCPGCGSTLEFGTTQNTDLQNINLTCDSCKLGQKDDDKPKIVPPFVDPIGRLFREERFIVIDEPIMRPKNTDKINISDDIIFNAEEPVLDITMQANHKVEPDIIEECDAD